MIVIKFIFILPFVTLSIVESTQQLNEYIQYYEPLNYNTKKIHDNHLRAKRSTESNQYVHLNFQAHTRHFNLRLKRDTSIFSKNFVVETPDGEDVDFDTSHVYEGHMPGEHGTVVYGSIRNGIFEGKIHTQNQTYYVERTHKYGLKDQPYHSVIYSENDVQDPYAEKRESHIGGCAGTGKVLQWMQDVSTAANPEDEKVHKKASEKDQYSFHENLIRKKRNFPDPSYSGKFHNIYTRNAQQYNPYSMKETNTEKRACSLYIQTDTFLWDHIRNYELSDTNIREEITSLVSQHIKAVNHIYENTDFDGFRGIKFVVQRIKINDTRVCEPRVKRANPFCSPNIDVSNFLNLNSQFNHDDFCLAYIFTYRDFSGGTLGLAWVASASGASGGICEKYKSYTENIAGRQVQTKRSLNTGVITFVNYNSRVPPKVSELTLAHEIGHNFGSPHDYPKECRPGGAKGNYIMYASATSGDRPHNNKFSECSIHNISAVLRAVFSNEGKENCFEKDDGAFCGNKIVEDGEECDCGYDEKECTEKCCYPKEVSKFLNLGEPALPCRLRLPHECSPSRGPCCDTSCRYVNKGTLCKSESDCTRQSRCDGYAAECPAPVAKANRTICNEGTQVCWNGECIGSICQRYDMEECFLTEEHQAKPEQMCEVACQDPGKESTCRSTYVISKMKNISGIKLRPGSPCNDFKGYCDVFQKCRAVDAEGPLARLKNLLFNQKTLMTIKQWVTSCWWGVLLSVVAFAIVMGIFIKCCAVHTPSSNPRRAPALKITDTLRHPADTLRRKRHRQPQPPPGPPPPYPGPRPTAPPAPGPAIAGPSHGYGEGRGHYNRRTKDQPPQPTRNKSRLDDHAYVYNKGTVMEMRGKAYA
ncbi:hypothetical protein JTE90_022809 [Oedothorax gibbosus]|uniref:ADAM10 endopeptidase n=1 Tax=Oedothorax gibbosus TaxID=931172 RepID=A0AAV6V5D1_9ARAC|nr:hypothetical protein JTE90_022809 [Oedothorax gibbosus]